MATVQNGGRLKNTRTLAQKSRENHCSISLQKLEIVSRDVILWYEWNQISIYFFLRPHSIVEVCGQNPAKIWSPQTIQKENKIKNENFVPLISHYYIKTTFVENFIEKEQLDEEISVCKVQKNVIWEKRKIVYKNNV